MVSGDLSHNLLKLVSSDGLPDSLANLIKFLKPGMVLEGVILKAFPEKNKAIVQLNNRQIIVETQKPLIPGNAFIASVVKSSPQLMLKIISEGIYNENKSQMIERNDKKPDNLNLDFTSLKNKHQNSITKLFTKSDLKDLNLIKGQLTEGRVVKIIDEKIATVAIQNKEVTVHFKSIFPPKLGTIIKIDMETYGDKIKFISKDDNVSNRLVKSTDIKPLLISQQSFGDMVQKLDALGFPSLLKTHSSTDTNLIRSIVETIKLLKPHSNIPPDSSVLKEQVEKSGINYESKVKNIFNDKSLYKILPTLSNDLKGQLIRVANILNTCNKEDEYTLESRRPLAEIIHTVRRAIDNIELQQLSNQLARQEGHPLVLQIPNPFIGDKKSINLYLQKITDKDTKRKLESKGGLLLVFLLDLTSLGKLRVDARLKSEDISIKISVGNDKIAQYINQNLKAFHSRLTDLGFKNDVTCQVVKNIEYVNENGFSKLFVNNREQLVDLTT